MSDDHDKNQLPAVREPQSLQAPAMHPIVAAVVETIKKSGEVKDLAALLALQERYEDREAEKAYTRDMVRLKAALPALVRKDKTHEFHKWTYASLEAYVEHITGPATLYGFSIGGDSQILASGDVEVEVIVTHVQGHSKSLKLHAPPDFGIPKKGTKDEYSRNLNQAISATTTSLRRTLLSLVFGLSSTDAKDSDGPGINLIKNVKFLERFKELGKSREEVEAYLGGDGPPVQLQEWTDEHLARLQAWGLELAKARR